MDKEEIVRIMQNRNNPSEVKTATKEPIIVQEEIPEPEETVEVAVPRNPLSVLPDHELLVYIARQTVRTNQLLTQIRNLYINRPLDWKSPEEEVSNGEIS